MYAKWGKLEERDHLKAKASQSNLATTFVGLCYIIVSQCALQKHEFRKSYCCTVHFCKITSIIYQQLHLYKFHIKTIKNTLKHSELFRSF